MAVETIISTVPSDDWQHLLCPHHPLFRCEFQPAVECTTGTAHLWLPVIGVTRRPRRAIESPLPRFFIASGSSVSVVTLAFAALNEVKTTPAAAQQPPHAVCSPCFISPVSCQS